MGWNSLVEKMRSSTGQDNPLEILAAQNEAMKQANGAAIRNTLSQFSDKNKLQEDMLQAKNEELNAKRAYLADLKAQNQEFYH